MLNISGAMDLEIEVFAAIWWVFIFVFRSVFNTIKRSKIY